MIQTKRRLLRPGTRFSFTGLVADGYPCVALEITTESWLLPKYRRPAALWHVYGPLGQLTCTDTNSDVFVEDGTDLIGSASA